MAGRSSAAVVRSLRGNGIESKVNIWPNFNPSQARAQHKVPGHQAQSCQDPRIFPGCLNSQLLWSVSRAKPRREFGLICANARSSRRRRRDVFLPSSGEPQGSSGTLRLPTDDGLPWGLWRSPSFARDRSASDETPGLRTAASRSGGGWSPRTRTVPLGRSFSAPGWPTSPRDLLTFQAAGEKGKRGLGQTNFRKSAAETGRTNADGDNPIGE